MQGVVRSPIQDYLETLHAACLEHRSGDVAAYIPELALADPDWFGICIATVDGHIYEVGDTRRPFTIQSMSKPFTYGLALADQGRESVLEKVGVEPSGDVFNAISLAPGTGRPQNPMINAGAITAASLVAGDSAEERLARLLDCYGAYAGRPLEIDEAVYASERATGHRNRAIGHMLRNFGILTGDPEVALDLYFRQCSVAVDCRDMSLMAATLANGGRHPLTRERVLSGDVVERVLSVMTTCGMYDGAGDWVDGVGLPAKSGVAGGVFAVLPGQLGIGVFSPPLNENGNSLRGVEVCRRLSRDLQLHFLRATRSPWAAVRASYDVASVPSKRVRAPADRSELDRVGARGDVYELHGDLLFAATETIVCRIVERAERADVVLLDVRRVGRICEPAANLLLDLRASMSAAGRQLVFVGAETYGLLGSVIAARATRGEPPLRVFADLDRATEWCEDLLLGRDGDGRIQLPAVTLAEHQLCRGFGEEDVALLAGVLQRRRYARGGQVVAAGDPSGEVYLLMDGEVSVAVELPDGGHRRVSTLTPGAMFGERAMIGSTRRSADVDADTDVELLLLSTEAFDALGETAPRLHAGLLRNMLSSAHDTIGRLTVEVGSLAQA